MAFNYNEPHLKKLMREANFQYRGSQRHGNAISYTINLGIDCLHIFNIFNYQTIKF